MDPKKCIKCHNIKYPYTYDLLVPKQMAFLPRHFYTKGSFNIHFKGIYNTYLLTWLINSTETYTLAPHISVWDNSLCLKGYIYIYMKYKENENGNTHYLHSI